LRMMMIVALACVPLAACGGGGARPAALAEKPMPYAVPVDAGCIGDKGRPTPPEPLNRRYTAEQWAALAPGAKAAAVAAQAGARLNYEDEDRAATAGCH
jgi:hypothetical protein